MTPGDKERYSRQILFPPIGPNGQEKIRNAQVAVVGCGALGSFGAEALARAGIGGLRLIDRDYVDVTNLQRQWLYSEADAAAETPKAVAATRRIAEINSSVQISSSVTDLTPSNAEELLEGVDVIFDGTDNFETRFLINDISVKHSIPWVYGAAIGSYGIVMPVFPDRGPCLACIYPEAPTGPQPTCDVDGVLSSATATIAASQTAMILRLLSGWDEFQAFVQTIDVWNHKYRQLAVEERSLECPTCAKRQFRFLENFRRVPVSLCGRNSVQLHESSRPLNLAELAERLSPVAAVKHNEFALRMSVADYQMTIFPDGRAIIKGTTDIGIARSLYARFVGL